MAVEIFMDNAIEPLTVQEPFSATMQSMGAAYNTHAIFFMSHDITGHPVAVNVNRVIYLRDPEAVTTS